MFGSGVQEIHIQICCIHGRSNNSRYKQRNELFVNKISDLSMSYFIESGTTRWMLDALVWRDARPTFVIATLSLKGLAKL